MSCAAPGHDRPAITLAAGGALRVRVLDVRMCSSGALEAVLECAIYALAGVTREPPHRPAVYIGTSARDRGSRWEVSLRQWTRVRGALRAQWVLLFDPNETWLDPDRLLIEAQAMRSVLSLGGVHLLNSRTAAPAAWKELPPRRRQSALRVADAIADTIAAQAFPGWTGGGLAASSGGALRDHWVRLLHQRELPATEQDLVAEGRLLGLHSGRTPQDSLRVDLQRREMRTGRPRIRRLNIAGKTWYAPRGMPRADLQTAARAQQGAADRVAAAVLAALCSGSTT